jgi:hypothetical protein
VADKESVEATRAWIGARVSEAILRDGTVAAFLRQGADEMGVALKAFPDSIHAEEPGSILNPTQGEIAADRKASRIPTPSEIAKDKSPYVPEHGQDHGRGMER